GRTDERRAFSRRRGQPRRGTALDWMPPPWTPPMSPRAASPRTGERAAALATDEAQALAAALAVAPGDPAGVHEARKSLRRLRSLLALGRAALGAQAVDAIDEELRALAKGLSALRDGQVVQDTARRLA